MQKIPTIFVRDETAAGHPVTAEVKSECQWALDGEGVATAKLDGTNVKIALGAIYKRQKPKDRAYDEASYVPCDEREPSDRWVFEAWDRYDRRLPDGVYELLGPKVQGNPHGYSEHLLARVVPPAQELVCGDDLVRTFTGMREYLVKRPSLEGIVFHHPDGRMAKIKRRDFGLPWPVGR